MHIQHRYDVSALVSSYLKVSHEEVSGHVGHVGQPTHLLFHFFSSDELSRGFTLIRQLETLLNGGQSRSSNRYFKCCSYGFIFKLCLVCL
jgi:hypothetical protein